MMANSFDVSHIRERNEEIRREVQANRIRRSLRNNSVHRFKARSKKSAALVSLAGKAALFCMGVLAVLALALVAVLLVPVMLAATVLPGIVVGGKRGQSVGRYAGKALKVSTPPKTVVASRQQAG